MSLTAFANLFGSMLVVSLIVSWIAVLIHIGITLYRPFQKQYSPRWFSHVAAFAILWLAYGTLGTVCERRFPYLQKATDTGAYPVKSPKR
jgi:hypothetical protein